MEKREKDAYMDQKETAGRNTQIWQLKLADSQLTY